jgi:FkbM family methyltransferase
MTRSPLVLASALISMASLISACNHKTQLPLGDASSPDDTPSTEHWLTGKPLYSQANEELIIRDHFRDRKNGYFLDVGSAWPIQYSNTYYLEKHLGWSGIAIDALPEYGPSWRQERPRSRFFSYLVSDHSDTVEPFYRSELPGISSDRLNRTGIGKDVDFEEIQVPTITLNDLLEQNGVLRIDFLSMDIEGAEPRALAGFDIDRYRPELVCIEAKPANRETIREYFVAHGYQQIDRYLEYDQTNYYFTPDPTLSADRPDTARELTVPPQRGHLLLLAQAAFALFVAHILPGALLVGLLRLGSSSLDRWVFAAALGGPLAASIYWVSLVTHWPASYWILLGAIDVAALFVIIRGVPSTPHDQPRTKPLLVLLLLLSVLVSAYLLTTGHFFQLNQEGNFVMDPAFTEDALFHNALVEGLQTSVPAELLSISGVRAQAYPVGYHLQVAAWQRFFGLDPYDGIYRVAPVFSLGLLVLSAYLFGLRFCKSQAVAVAATALLFGGGLGFLALEAPGASWWSLVFMDGALVSILLIDPLLSALPLLFVGLACLDDYLRHGHRGALAGSALTVAALFTVKGLLGAQILAAFALAAVLARGPGVVRARRAALVLALASMLAVIAPTAGFSKDAVGLRPLEIVRYSMETLGLERWAEALIAVGKGDWAVDSLARACAATALWFVGFLGLRLLAARGILRDAFSRSGSLRNHLAIFALIGFPLTLLLRIAPAEATGFPAEEARNSAFWFATLSGIVMWYWTAETLAAIGSRGKKTLALVVGASALVAFPNTIQHFVHRARLSARAESVPATAVAAARACRALSRPSEVFVEPPTRVRPSVVAHLGARPVVYESFVGQSHSWLSRDALDFRRRALSHFWNSEDPRYGSWFLSHFNVQWIYTPQDRLSPMAGVSWTVPAFSNDAATVYRVGELQESPLTVPGILPLGTRGSAFFGTGWGSPESSPRLRRLMPGVASIYVPLNEDQSALVSLGLRTPHVGGILTFANEHVDVEPEQDQVALVYPASETRRGLNRLELVWHGSEPLIVTSVQLSQ